MSDLLNTAAGTLTPAAVGTHVDISFTPTPGIRNNWNPQPVQVNGTLDSVRVYGHGSVRAVIDGVTYHLPESAPVRVAAHLRVPDTAVTAQSPSAATDDTRATEEVRAGILGKRVGVGELSVDDIGRTVEFDFRGARFFGELTAFKSALGMFSVTLDGTERFLFDDEQSLVVGAAVRGAAPVAALAPATPGPEAGPAARFPAAATSSAVSGAPAIPDASPSGPAVVPVASAWVPVPADELEFV
ncbi:hypothetical protein [Curtobacterium sp. MCSS17_016]|uniref:hypothetical protein n=1 Tax=Curtobacterium sp. MCSS17_016 TaxID=2175644 RepID=UPI0011B6F7DC|nr:hypothetical protein [Curtobacterium sp. MCSS17_016]WIE81194.1 hypothetical protein DEJ19_018345 [Curtobacterium sp. MCSS17_016]